MSVTNEQIYALLERIALKLDVPLVDPEPEPLPSGTGGLVFPSGNIRSKAPNGSNRWQSIPWTQVSRWEPIFTEECTKEGIAPLLVVAFALVESNAQHYTDGGMSFKGTLDPARGQYGNIIVRKQDAYDNVPAVGMMQIKLGYHAQPDIDGYSVRGNIRLAARLLKRWIDELGSWEAALIQRYHPGEDHDSGVTQLEYIRAIRDIIAEVKSAQTTSNGINQPKPGVPTTNPFPKPVIYDLSRDYARFGLTEQQANTIINKRFNNRYDPTSRIQGDPRCIVNHIQDGTTNGSLKWWLQVSASSNYMANRDGSILKIVPVEHGPWTNGDVCNPTQKSNKIRTLGGNPNIWSITCEAEGYSGKAASVTYTPAQLEAILWLYAEMMLIHKIPLELVLSHATFNFCDRANCPGEANHLAVLDGLAKAGFK